MTVGSAEGDQWSGLRWGIGHRRNRIQEQGIWMKRSAMSDGWAQRDGAMTVGSTGGDQQSRSHWGIGHRRKSITGGWKRERAMCDV